MIVRMWRGEAKREMADAYRAHLEQSVFPQLKKLPGFIGAELLNRERDGKTEVVVMSKWDSMNAVRSFAGDRPERAVVEPQAREVLSSFDETVAHYEIMLEA